MSGSPARREEGVALMTAMLIVAMATLIVADLVWNQHVNRRRTANILLQEKARQYALGAEDLARMILKEDTEADDAQDDHSEGWCTRDWDPEEECGAVAYAIDEGELFGRMVDMQGRFNLNNLISGVAVSPIPEQQFRRLLTTLEFEERPPLNDGEASELTDALIDWIDEDTIPYGIGGAEDGYYTGLNPPYLAPNTWLTTPTELLAVKGFTREIYDALAPHVTALLPDWCGTSDPTRINVNTATANVLMALDPGIDAALAEAWVEELAEEGWSLDVAEATIKKVIDKDELVTGNYIGVESNCFGAFVIVDIGTAQLSMYSLLDRSGASGVPRPRFRRFGVF
ncbi:MAG: type II secretion system minor pseudopilin GspK [Gammaproteobacteria bacterium]